LLKKIQPNNYLIKEHNVKLIFLFLLLSAAAK
jgi:hypothetical protein